MRLITENDLKNTLEQFYSKIKNDIPNSGTGNTSMSVALKIGNTSKTFNGSSNLTWTLSDIGAAASSHTHAATDITQTSSYRFVTDTEKSTWNAKASTAAATTSANGLMTSAMVTKLNGIATSAQKNSDITKAEIEAKLTGAITSHTHNYAASSHTHSNYSTTDHTHSNYAASSHTHSYAGASSAGGAATSANKVNTNLVIKLNGGSTENTNMFTFNGSAAKSINITASSIGAAASSHGTHLSLGTSSDTAYRGDRGNTAYNHSQAAHAPSNAQKNSDITKAEIEAKLTGAITSHTHNAVGGLSFWTGTKSQYDALSSKSSSTVYIIKE